MTDLSPGAAPAPQSAEPAQQPAPQAPEPVASASAPQPAAVTARWAKRRKDLRILFGREPEPDGRPSFIWLERWDAFIVATFITIGVPLLGASGFAWSTKLFIGMLWFAAWSTFFYHFELRELIGQMTGRGAIKAEQLSQQQDSAQEPRYAVRYAIFIWLLAYVVHVVIKVFPIYGTLPEWKFITVTIPVQIYHSWWDSWISYGIVEWLALVHAWFVTKKLINRDTYDVGNIFSKAAPMGERVNLSR